MCTPGAFLISVPGALGYIYAGWPHMADYPNVIAFQPPLAHTPSLLQ